MSNQKELDETFDYYLANLETLAEKYKGKYIAIKGHDVLGAYDTFDGALNTTEKQGYQRGTFLIQKASFDPSAYTITHLNNYTHLRCKKLIS